MTVSLYDMTVTAFLQTLGGVSGFLDRSLRHFKEAGVDPDGVVETRLIGDMLPFRFQVQSVVHHSKGAIDGVRDGRFGPPSGLAQLDYAGLQALVAQARSDLQALTREEVDGLAGREVIFQVGENRLPFTAEGFLGSFSLPNFYFHATTAYDILRMKGAPLGKRDFLGQLRLKS
jgi:hypothetical protein